MRGASLVKVFNLLMLCEVIAYILSRQRLSAKTFVTGCVFYALQDRLSLWVLCDTSGVGGFPLHFSTGSPFGHHPRLRMVCPPLGIVGYFFSYQEKQTLWRSVFSHSCGLICRAQKYNKGVG